MCSDLINNNNNNNTNTNIHHYYICFYFMCSLNTEYSCLYIQIEQIYLLK